MSEPASGTSRACTPVDNAVYVLRVQSSQEYFENSSSSSSSSSGVSDCLANGPWLSKCRSYRGYLRLLCPRKVGDDSASSSMCIVLGIPSEIETTVLFNHWDPFFNHIMRISFIKTGLDDLRENLDQMLLSGAALIEFCDAEARLFLSSLLNATII